MELGSFDRGVDNEHSGVVFCFGNMYLVYLRCRLICLPLDEYNLTEDTIFYFYLLVRHQHLGRYSMSNVIMADEKLNLFH